MQAHIRKTIEEIDGDIVKLKQDTVTLIEIREGLVNLYAGDEEIPDAPEPARAPKALSPRRATLTKLLESGPLAAASGTSRVSGESVRLMNFMRTAPEPFTAVSLAVGTGLNGKLIGNHLFRWKARGYVVKTGRGEFKRAPKFPSGTPGE